MSNRHTSFKLDLAPGYVSPKVRRDYSARGDLFVPRPRIPRDTKGYPRNILGMLIASFVVGFMVACAFGYGG
jgi:hypothetical protein